MEQLAKKQGPRLSPVNPFQKVFNLLCPDPAKKSLSMAAVALQNVIS